MRLSSMNKRRAFLARLTGTTALLALGGCDHKRRQSAPATPSLDEHIHKAVVAMAFALGGLQGSVGEFDTKDWRYVVPEVQDDTKKVSTAFTELKRALGYVVDF
jgi:hypothetical protein